MTVDLVLDALETARVALFRYIEDWYNRKRIQGSIGYFTPAALKKSVMPQCKRR